MSLISYDINFKTVWVCCIYQEKNPKEVFNIKRLVYTLERKKMKINSHKMTLGDNKWF